MSHAQTGTARDTSPTTVHRRESIGLWALLVLSYAAAFLPADVPGLVALVAGWIPVAFAFWHFARWAGAGTAALSFLVISVVSFTAEALGVATGLVFGDYFYPDGPLGPLLFGVPPLILLQYFAMGYASLFVARAIAGGVRTALGGALPVLAVSALAAFCLTALDLASDPWQSTHLGEWVWRDGGSYFGVPIHNFVGWWVEALIFFVLVNLLLARTSARRRIERPRTALFDVQAVLLYGTFPFAIIVRPLVHGPSELADALAGVSLFAVVPLLVAALVALHRR